MIFMIERLAHTRSGYAFLLSATGYPVMKFVEKYVFNDWQFLVFLVVVVGVDTVLGFWKNWRYHTLSSAGFSKLFTKILIYGSVLVLTHVLTRFTIGGEANTIFSWFDTVMYSAIMVREAISIVEKVGAISPGILPRWILKRLQAFDNSGNPKDLTHGQT